MATIVMVSAGSERHSAATDDVATHTDTAVPSVFRLHLRVAVQEAVLVATSKFASGH